MRSKILALLALWPSFTARADTLENVRKKGFVQCGVSQGLPGFSNPDDKGNWSGLDVDYCRALAAAVFGDSTKVKFRPLSAKERFTALQSGEIDVLSRATTWTLQRDTGLGVDYAGVIYYDGQGFMTRKKLGVKSVKELDGATICVNLGTTTELNLADYFRAKNLKYKLVAYEKADEVVQAYEAGRCDAMTADQSALYADRSRMKTPDEHLIFSEVISKEPLGPLVRHGDQKWGDVARWTLFAMLEAEELGISSQNAAKLESSSDPALKRFFGKDGNLGKAFGLDNGWAGKIVSQVGNYGEVFEKNLGNSTKLKIARGQNNLWNKGGLQYGMPIR